jgi:oligopeptide transport system ATP-binding protein
MAQCVTALPPLFEPLPGQLARCWLHHADAPRVDSINRDIEAVA